MNRKFRTFSTLTALFTGVAGLSSFAAPAPEPLSIPDISPEMLSAMQRDLGLTPEQSLRRMSVEMLAAHTEKRLAAQLGDTFAGAWMNEEGTQLIVAITDEANAPQVLREGAQPKLVARSLVQLNRLQASLDRLAERAPRGVGGWYVDITTNTVVVFGQDLTLAKAFIADSGLSDEAAVRVELTREEPRTVYDIRGGDAYYPTGVRCSIGFAVNGGFVTAGHCGGVGTATTGSGVAQGTVRGSTFPTNDYAWVQTNGSWASTPYVNNYAGGVVAVQGSNEAAVGSSICRSGSTTGWRCGTLEAKNITVNYSNGPVYGMVQTSACAEGGDSGGSFISGNQAQGVTSGVAGNCSTAGTKSFYQPLLPILSKYGLSLTTTGGGGGKAVRSRLNNKCIDIPNSNTNDGTQLQMWDCNGTGAQNWTWYSDGSLRALGKCMDVAWGSVDAGAIIQIATCSGNPAQKFVLSGAGDLVNPQSNKCVDIVDHNTNSGAKLIQWHCTGSANQKWYQ
ncbi:ricin-type beta-trefoil lectin domain protein [Melittangium boletus]|uniref:Ricin B lectin domain-containing protein n=1 Tax=Melittangium boletus DSM 14713 TaxID=1294270 RepID=A0A250IBK6_9BACT|nr:ricin-type beta-trefoil lectin domain protein [Melittangium boletus]ATB28517.1 hypothetical protein MEBOL_001965 [Melittangium boletus DSM 14713]